MSLATKHTFATYKKNNTIENGDLVVLYLSKENLILIRIQESQEFCCKFGNYKHADMIGLQYGTKLGSNTGRGFVFLLYPTPELWTLILPHRTQILYIADISLIMSYLDLKPGKVMIESGTGSGSFSHSIARTIAPGGHLFTFEYHQERVAVATKEFEDHGLQDLVTIECRDVCKNGFGLVNKADAVFLDLPAPWEAVASAKQAFRQDKVGKICTFSPCIEQISKTVTALTEQGFVDIKMYECLIRFNEVRILQISTLDEALEMERASEKKRKRALPRVLRESFKNRLQQERDSQEQDDDQEDMEGEGEEEGESAVKKTRVDDDDNASQQGSSTLSSAVGTPSSFRSHADVFIPDESVEPRESIESKNVTVTRLPVEQRGHTSYLLFATFTPATQQPSLTERNKTAAAASK
ncbi:tRNA (adenine-N(1)-)-methyltransferase catalytic subunit trm61 [Linnemannia gamsii]|uniref:tRNA (adenine(58)-N(1))-methyltransferase catalytic subunit TRM61 n=1 Tax=Linnemannia gamsii TaxID=64522 RepID=A0ABQ7JXR7_9FUNG|nr:tRNA (adenine-N(1)-)-methyltransferase catalytic subunit trm61 [Linnemannia gamsii]